MYVKNANILYNIVITNIIIEMKILNIFDTLLNYNLIQRQPQIILSSKQSALIIRNLILTEKYDVVVSSLAIHYVEDFNKLCHDVYNILTDKGYFIFSQEHPIGTGVILNKECNLKDTIKIGNKDYFLVSDYNNNGKISIIK